jgi:hypothetical protein
VTSSEGESSSSAHSLRDASSNDDSRLVRRLVEILDDVASSYTERFFSLRSFRRSFGNKVSLELRVFEVVRPEGEAAVVS